MTIQTPFSSPSTEVVRPEYIDNNGHMNVGYYHVLFDIAASPFFTWLGLTPEFRSRNGSSTFALESHLNFLREVKLGDELRFEARLIDIDYKRIHYYLEMFHAADGYLAATYESLSTHVDMTARRTAPIPADLKQRLEQVLAAHRALPRPPHLGRAISAHPPKRQEPQA